MIKIYEGYLDEYVINITNKSRYDYYRYKGNDFAYDKKNNLLLYLYKDEEDGNYYEVEAIGLRPNNWKNKNVRDEYIEEYLDELNMEISYLANDFIKNELPYYQNESYGYKKESRNRKVNGKKRVSESKGNKDIANEMPSTLVYCLNKFEETGKTVRKGFWQISNGGYDLWYEIYYVDEPVIKCVDGKVMSEEERYNDLAYKVAEYYGDDYVRESKNRKVNGKKRVNEGHTEDGYMGATKWVGDKSHLHLYGKDLASAIRQDLKDNGISGCTVRAGKATYTTTITITVKGNPNDKLTYDEFLNTDWEDAAFGYGGRFWFSDGPLMYTEYLNADTETQKELSRKIYDVMVANKTTFDINKHYIDKSYNSIFTQQLIKKLQKINDIVIEFNYDDSNGMVDYFETNFYYDIVVVFK